MEPKYLISNEADYPRVLSRLRSSGRRGGAYIGVGSEQNFTYIAGTRPKVAFIVDYRRENLLLHLLFKALFELARTRREYLALLLSIPRDAAEDTGGSPSLPHLIEYVSRRDGDDGVFRENLARILPRIHAYRRNLSREDDRLIEAIYAEFFSKRLDIRWTPEQPAMFGLPVPTYRDLLLATDEDGRCGHFLNSDDDFTFLQQKHRRNLILPIKGDFSGPKTLKTIGAFLRDREERLSTFYLSNVEYFFFETDNLDAFDTFVRNVETLPLQEDSVFIRAFVNTREERHPESDGGTLLTSLVQFIRSFLRLYKAGRYQTYRDVGTVDYIKTSL